jgi:hypothetical protein
MQTQWDLAPYQPQSNHTAYSKAYSIAEYSKYRFISHVLTIRQAASSSPAVATMTGEGFKSFQTAS